MLHRRPGPGTGWWARDSSRLCGNDRRPRWFCSITAVLQGCREGAVRHQKSREQGQGQGQGQRAEGAGSEKPVWRPGCGSHAHCLLASSQPRPREAPADRRRAHQPRRDLALRNAFLSDRP